MTGVYYRRAVAAPLDTALIVLGGGSLLVSLAASLILTVLLYRAKSHGSYFTYAKWTLSNPFGSMRFVFRELEPARRRRALVGSWLLGGLIGAACVVYLAVSRHV